MTQNKQLLQDDALIEIQPGMFVKWGVIREGYIQAKERAKYRTLELAAIGAMQSLISKDLTVEWVHPQVAKAAIGYAHALVEALEKEEHGDEN
jgi:hypothetical protein